MNYFRVVITRLAQTSDGQLRGRRALTTQHLERFIFCLNCVEDKRFIPLIDLVKEIKQRLEYNRVYNIDRKTVKMIVQVLESEGLLKLSEVRVTYEYWRRQDADDQSMVDENASESDLGGAASGSEYRPKVKKGSVVNM